MRPDLDALLAKWQRILRLQDWNIKIGYRRAFDMDANLQGSVSWVIRKKSALIRILEPNDFDPDIQWPQDVEKTIVHELLHLHLAPFDKSEGVSEALMEQAVDAISCALIDRDRKGRA